MKNKEITIKVREYDSLAELSDADKILLQAAERGMDSSYAPYSGFRVGAAVSLANGQIVTGANQENASYPMCVCAEVATLSAAATQYPGVAITRLAVTARSKHHAVLQPAAPCGQCRQTILEYEMRHKQDIGILMGSESGKCYSVDTIRDLLPIHFSAADL
jgi:cytidine deaminase